MPRPRVPTAILEARGAYLRNPQRKRERGGEPSPMGELGEPPEHLDRAEKEAWREVAANIPPGVAKNSDRVAMEIVSCLLVAFRRKRIGAAELSQLSSLLGRMGLTPADRSRVVATGLTQRGEECVGFVIGLPRFGRGHLLGGPF